MTQFSDVQWCNKYTMSNTTDITTDNEQKSMLLSIAFNLIPVHNSSCLFKIHVQGPSLQIKNKSYATVQCL